MRKQNKKIKFKPLDYGLNIHYGQVNEVISFKKCAKCTFLEITGEGAKATHRPEVKIVFERKREKRFELINTIQYFVKAK